MPVPRGVESGKSGPPPDVAITNYTTYLQKNCIHFSKSTKTRFCPVFQNKINVINLSNFSFFRHNSSSLV